MGAAPPESSDKHKTFPSLQCSSVQLPYRNRKNVSYTALPAEVNESGFVHIQHTCNRLERKEKKNLHDLHNIHVPVSLFLLEELFIFL